MARIAPAPQVLLVGLTIFGLGQWSIFPPGGGRSSLASSIGCLRLRLLRWERAGPNTKLAELSAATGLAVLSRFIHHCGDCGRPLRDRKLFIKIDFARQFLFLWTTAYFPQTKMCGMSLLWASRGSNAKRGGSFVIELHHGPGEDHGSLSYPFACRSMSWLKDHLESAQRNANAARD